MQMKTKESKKSIRKESGITLIALVVTIVVLLILAGITITIIFNDSGIINKAREVAESVDKSHTDTEKELANLTDKLGETLGEPTLPNNDITFSQVWKDNKASVTFNTQTNYKIEYSKNSTNSWKEVSNGGTVSDFVYGDTIHARLAEGETKSNAKEYKIKDEVSPMVTISSTKITGDWVVYTVSIEAKDSESGLDNPPVLHFLLSKTEDFKDSREISGNLSENSFKKELFVEQGVLTYDDRYGYIKASATDKAGNVGFSEYLKLDFYVGSEIVGPVQPN